MKNAWALFVFGALFSGCATGPIATSRADDVPPSRLLSHKWLSPSPGAGHLIVKRDGGVIRAACNIRVYVDDIAVADLRSLEKVALFLPAGDHVVKGETTGLCSGGASAITMEISPEGERVIRIISGKHDGIELRGSIF